MPRRLKTFVTASGFFELAVAAPSMKAALELWGAGPGLFQRGYARETTDAAIVKATLAKPGVVLQRGVGSTAAFSEHAELPDIMALDKGTKKNRPATVAPKSAPKIDPAAEKKAAELYDKAQRQRAGEKARAKAEEQKAQSRQEQEIKKAEDAVAAAQVAHDKRINAIERRIAEFEAKAREEDEHWKAENERLEDRLRKLRE